MPRPGTFIGLERAGSVRTGVDAGRSEVCDSGGGGTLSQGIEAQPESKAAAKTAHPLPLPFRARALRMQNLDVVLSDYYSNY